MEKVKELIQNMIIRLKEQATSEQSAEAKCAADLADISKNKEDHELNLKQKKAQLEQKEASTELNTEAISNLGSELREATDIFHEKESLLKNQTADLTQEIVELQEVRAFLDEFSGDLDKSLVVGGSGSNTREMAEPVLAIIEMVRLNVEKKKRETELAKADAKTDLTESTTAHASYKSGTEASIDGKKKIVANNKITQQNLQQDIAAVGKQLQISTEMLEKTTTYCNGGSRESRYEDRKQQRQEEIDSLKTALQVLEESGAAGL